MGLFCDSRCNFDSKCTAFTAFRAKKRQNGVKGRVKEELAVFLPARSPTRISDLDDVTKDTAPSMTSGFLLGRPIRQTVIADVDILS